MKGSRFIAVGSYGDAESRNLRILEFDCTAYTIKEVKAVKAGENPSYAVPSRNGNLLYAVNELNRTAHGTFGRLKSFSLNRGEHFLQEVGDISSAGDDPCYIAETPDRRFLIVIHYSGGSFALIRLDEQGIPSELVHKTKLVGFGPNRLRQLSAHPHWAAFSPDNRFLYIPDLGSDRIWLYRLTEEGILQAPAAPAVIMSPGSGPRVLRFDSEYALPYCLNELGSTVTLFQYDSSTGMLYPREELLTIPTDFHGSNTAAELQLFQGLILVSNRGHDSIMVAETDQKGISSKPVWFPSGGKGPRSFIPFSGEAGELLIAVANRFSNSVHIFIRKGDSAEQVSAVKIPQPSSLRFVPEYGD